MTDRELLVELTAMLLELRGEDEAGEVATDLIEFIESSGRADIIEQASALQDDEEEDDPEAEDEDDS